MPSGRWRSYVPSARVRASLTSRSPPASKASTRASSTGPPSPVTVPATVPVAVPRRVRVAVRTASRSSPTRPVATVGRGSACRERVGGIDDGGHAADGDGERQVEAPVPGHGQGSGLGPGREDRLGHREVRELVPRLGAVAPVLSPEEDDVGHRDVLAQVASHVLDPGLHREVPRSLGEDVVRGHRDVHVLTQGKDPRNVAERPLGDRLHPDDRRVALPEGVDRGRHLGVEGHEGHGELQASPRSARPPPGPRRRSGSRPACRGARGTGSDPGSRTGPGRCRGRSRPPGRWRRGRRAARPRTPGGTPAPPRRTPSRSCSPARRDRGESRPSRRTRERARIEARPGGSASNRSYTEAPGSVMLATRRSVRHPFAGEAGQR